MPSTIGWLAVAIAVGSLVGLVLGHWTVVAARLHRCLEDPVGRPRDAARAPPLDERLGRSS